MNADIQCGDDSAVQLSQRNGNRPKTDFDLLIDKRVAVFARFENCFA
jgi:hypothetical protein